ncbi:unnamed protein product [Ixodes pacificus]
MLSVTLVSRRSVMVLVPRAYGDSANRHMPSSTWSRDRQLICRLAREAFDKVSFEVPVGQESTSILLEREPSGRVSTSFPLKSRRSRRFRLVGPIRQLQKHTIMVFVTFLCVFYDR